MSTLHLLKTNDLLDSLKDRFLSQEEEIERLRAQIKELKDEHYKDKELTKAKDTIDRLIQERPFVISERSRSIINHWLKDHQCPLNGIINSYRFEPIPGIGYSAYVKCLCGKEICFYAE